MPLGKAVVLTTCILQICGTLSLYPWTGPGLLSGARAGAGPRRLAERGLLGRRSGAMLRGPWR